VSTEAICYGVLDFFAKVVFGWIVILNLGLLANGSKGGRWATLAGQGIFVFPLCGTAVSPFLLSLCLQL